jgi:hypothetical protein
MKKGKANRQIFTKISEFIFERQQGCKDGLKVPPLGVQG